MAYPNNGNGNGNGNGHSPVEEVEIDLRQYIKVLRKHSRLIAIGTLAAIITAGLLSYFVLPPVFQAKSLLMVTQASDKAQVIQQEQQGESLEDVVGSVSKTPIMTMYTYLGQMKSEALMKMIIDDLELDPKLYTPGGLAGMISAEVQKDSNLIDVRVSNNDPELAARITNSLDKCFLNMLSKKNEEQMSRSVSFLQKQREETDNELKNATEALKAVQSQPRGVAVLEQEFTKKTEDLANYDSRLKMAGVELQQLYAGTQLLKAELKGTPRLITTEKYDNGRSYTSQDINPLYITIYENLNEKQSALAEKQAEVAGLQSVVSSLSRELDVLQAELVSKRVQEESLQRDVDRLKETSETLAKKTTETKIAKSIDLGDTNVMVVSEASIPTSPVKPNKRLNMAIAFILGLLAFSALAFFMEYLDNTLKSPEDIENYLHLPVIGVIPLIDEQSGKHAAYGG